MALVPGARVDRVSAPVSLVGPASARVARGDLELALEASGDRESEQVVLDALELALAA